MPRLEFFFDCSSPWTYLAFHRVEAVAAEAGAELVWRPILVGGVFNAVNGSVYEQRANPVPAKLRYHAKDLGDWAAHYGLAIRWPDVFPVNSVKAMRGCLVAADEGRLPRFARAVFEAYWGRGEDISQDAVLAPLAAEAGLGAEAFFGRIARPEVKARLRANTDELIQRGGFGSPTLFVDGDDMYFGNDRLPLVQAALARGR
ncbi:MAG: 2-hydroxychromene-2-carboxylate isomerase [Myxococcota bacterium]